ncbi:MAG: hypothetical protein J7551_00180 [Chloroflexi bacterium]|nr:hypothetical protein [Chloroflexota bacterium]
MSAQAWLPRLMIMLCYEMLDAPPESVDGAGLLTRRSHRLPIERQAPCHWRDLRDWFC